MAIPLVAAAALGTTPGQAATPYIDLLLYQANVDLYQTKLSIPIGGTISLDLILDWKLKWTPPPLLYRWLFGKLTASCPMVR